MRQLHTIPPVFDRHSKILILGSFPSVKSRAAAFFYGHPQNRFWQVLAAVLACELPVTTEEKRALLLRHHIALWDVVASCEITGSDDASIRNALPNDLSAITAAADIRRIFTNGGTADRLYRRLCRAQTGMDAIKLPSTSPANARYTLERLTAEWGAAIGREL